LRRCDERRVNGMLWSLKSTATQYLLYYQDFFVERWQNMTPTEYAGLLMFIAFAGWLLMKSHLK
jgi:hypothetical protein